MNQLPQPPRRQPRPEQGVQQGPPMGIMRLVVERKDVKISYLKADKVEEVRGKIESISQIFVGVMQAAGNVRLVALQTIVDIDESFLVSGSLNS